MTLPLGQLTLRERSALCSLEEEALESKGFRHELGKNPLTVRAHGRLAGLTAVLQCHVLATSVTAAGHSSTIVTEVIATGESGMSLLLRGALTILSTTSMPLVTWPKIV